MECLHAQAMFYQLMRTKVAEAAETIAIPDVKFAMTWFQ